MRFNECGVNAALLATFSCIVITFIACCVTILCRATLRIGWNVAVGSVTGTTVVDATIAGRLAATVDVPVRRWLCRWLVV